MTKLEKYENFYDFIIIDMKDLLDLRLVDLLTKYAKSSKSKIILSSLYQFTETDYLDNFKQISPETSQTCYWRLVKNNNHHYSFKTSFVSIWDRLTEDDPSSPNDSPKLKHKQLQTVKSLEDSERIRARNSLPSSDADSVNSTTDLSHISVHSDSGFSGYSADAENETKDSFSSMSKDEKLVRLHNLKSYQNVYLERLKNLAAGFTAEDSNRESQFLNLNPLFELTNFQAVKPEELLVKLDHDTTETSSARVIANFNLLEKAANPKQLLKSSVERLQARGTYLLATNFNWDSSIAPENFWLGGDKVNAENYFSHTGLIDFMDTLGLTLKKSEQILQTVSKVDGIGQFYVNSVYVFQKN